MSHHYVTLEQVSLRYPKSDMPAITNISLHIERGHCVALVGPSGCGKSSILRLLGGLETPTSGKVIIDGNTADQTREAVGMAFQKSTMLDWRTVLDNVLLPLEVTDGPTIFRKHYQTYRQRAEASLERLGLADYINRYPWEMSGGMQQRASLCRALIHEPSLLLLDEPFAALDAFTREDLWGLVQTIREERHPTTILVTHDLREAVFLADTVYVFSKGPGRIVHREEVELSRPRTITGTFEPSFNDTVQRLRAHITNVREGTSHDEPAQHDEESPNA